MAFCNSFRHVLKVLLTFSLFFHQTCKTSATYPARRWQKSWCWRWRWRPQPKRTSCQVIRAPWGMSLNIRIRYVLGFIRDLVHIIKAIMTYVKRCQGKKKVCGNFNDKATKNFAAIFVAHSISDYQRSDYQNLTLYKNAIKYKVYCFLDLLHFFFFFSIVVWLIVIISP